MTAIRINFDKEVEKLIHYPRFEGTPLYTRIPNCREKYANSQEDYSSRQPAWIKWSQLSYGSPNNIRRVFITSEGVKTHLYQPVVNKSVKGKNTSLKREGAYKDFKMQEVLGDLMRGSRNYVITKTGLNALATPWVASNIEEIYFDWTILLSDDIMNMGKGNLFNELTAPSNVGITRSSLPFELFEFACRSEQDIRTKFPRLRVIGYIQQLDRVYNMVGYKGGEESVEEMGKLWCSNKIVKAAGMDPNCRILLYNVPNVSKYNTEYRSREGIYLFDLEVLQPYFENRNKRINEFKAGIVKKGSEVVNTNKTQIEITLDEIYNRDGEAFIERVINEMFTSRDYARQTLKDMSTEGQKRYSRWLGR